MNKTSLSVDEKNPYVRGFSAISLLVFLLASIPSITGTFYLLVNPEFRNLRYVSGLLIWIFFAYLIGSTTFVKIYFISNGIMVKDGLLWGERRLFYPYEEIKYIKVHENRVSFSTGRFSSYTYLIKKDNQYRLQRGIEIYIKWKEEKNENEQS